jgi:hypothetical protein
LIKGITHDEDGNLQKITKYKGKLSTGYAPNEHPNTTNSPKAAGFFRILKEQTTSKRIGASQKMVVNKDWVLNEPIQKFLVDSLPGCLEQPRRIEIVCLFKSIPDMWESSLSMFNSDGLVCKSNGLGTNAKLLEIDPSGNRKWVDREFDGKKGCAFRECPDHKAGKCKPHGLLKCFPAIDMSTNPYRFETGSINTIIGIESSLQNLEMLLGAAHAVKQMEADEPLHYDGFFGAKLYLVHRKIKSGGRDVHITDLLPTEEFTETVMAPIKRGLDKRKADAKLIGSAGNVSMLQKAGQAMLESPQGIEDAEVSSDEAEVTVDLDSPDEGKSTAPVTEQDKFEEDKDNPGPNPGEKIAETLLGDDKKD